VLSFPFLSYISRSLDSELFEFSSLDTSTPNLIVSNMSSSSSGHVSFSQLLPTHRNLSELLEKLVSVFGVEPIFEWGGRLPSQPLQREIGDATPRYVLKPMVGNDFHVQTSFGSSPSYKAVMQLHLDQNDERSDKICLPLCDVALQPRLETAATSARQMAKLLLSAWPDANVGLSKRRQLGPPFIDPGLPDYQLFRWLASKDLNPVSEGVSLIHLYSSNGWLYRPYRQVAVRSFLLTPSMVSRTRTDLFFCFFHL
jgi:hypothetical protein